MNETIEKRFEEAFGKTSGKYCCGFLIKSRMFSDLIRPYLEEINEGFMGASLEIADDGISIRYFVEGEGYLGGGTDPNDFIMDVFVTCIETVEECADAFFDNEEEYCNSVESILVFESELVNGHNDYTDHHRGREISDYQDEIRADYDLNHDNDDAEDSFDEYMNNIDYLYFIRKWCYDKTEGINEEEEKVDIY